MHHHKPRKEAIHNAHAKAKDDLEFQYDDDRMHDPGERDYVNYFSPNTGLDRLRTEPVDHDSEMRINEPHVRYNMNYDNDDNGRSEKRHGTNHRVDSYAGEMIDEENTLSHYIAPPVFETGGHHHKSGDKLLFGSQDAENTDQTNTHSFLKNLGSLLAPLSLPETLKKSLQAPKFADSEDDYNRKNDVEYHGSYNVLKKDGEGDYSDSWGDNKKTEKHDFEAPDNAHHTDHYEAPANAHHNDHYEAPDDAHHSDHFEAMDNAHHNDHYEAVDTGHHTEHLGPADEHEDAKFSNMHNDNRDFKQGFRSENRDGYNDMDKDNFREGHGENFRGNDGESYRDGDKQGYTGGERGDYGDNEGGSQRQGDRESDNFSRSKEDVPSKNNNVDLDNYGSDQEPKYDDLQRYDDSLPRDDNAPDARSPDYGSDHSESDKFSDEAGVPLQSHSEEPFSKHEEGLDNGKSSFDENKGTGDKPIEVMQDSAGKIHPLSKGAGTDAIDEDIQKYLAPNHGGKDPQ